MEVAVEAYKSSLDTFENLQGLNLKVEAVT